MCHVLEVMTLCGVLHPPPRLPRAQGTHYSEGPSTGKAMQKPLADPRHRGRPGPPISFLKPSTS